MSKSLDNRSFVLQLDERQAWNLTGTNGTEAWLEEFAAVLRLPAGNWEGLPKMTFIRGRSAGPPGSDPPWPPDVAELQIVAEERWESNHQGLVRFWSRHEGHDLVCELLNSYVRQVAILTMAQALRPVYEAAIRSRGLPLHGALVARNGQGVLIAGASGAGKTTCCRRLPAPWKGLSDDEVLVLHREGRGYLAHPLPTWSCHFDSQAKQSWDLTERVSLAAVFFLQQAPCVAVLPMGRASAAAKINTSAREASFWRLRAPEPRGNESLSTAVFDNACHIAQAVPVYTLRLDLRGTFWEEIERVLGDL
jgi:SynChlorMet cassette protein ScmC